MRVHVRRKARHLELQRVALTSQPLLLLEQTGFFAGQVLNSALHKFELLRLHHGFGVALADVGVQLEHLISLFVEFLFASAQ